MDEIFYDVVDLLKALISTPSVSREEQAAADIIENFLKARGCTTQRCGNNVWTIAPGYSHERPTLLLNSHIDTVRPVDGWTRNPFSPDDDGERIYGLGSNATISYSLPRARRKLAEKEASRRFCRCCPKSTWLWWANPRECTPLWLRKD